MTSDSMSSVTVELDSAQALALAQLMKRISWSECRQNAVDDDEAYVMRDGCEAVRRALADAGFAPR